MLSAILAGVGLSMGAGTASAQAAAPEAAPPPPGWMAYAELVNRTLTGWLSEKGEVPERLRAYLDQMRPTADAPPPAVRVKVWISSEGMITRIDFTPFVHPQPNMDLRSLLIGRMLPDRPPQDMRQPIRMELQLKAERAVTGGLI